MRRAAVQAFRTARRSHVRRILAQRTSVGPYLAQTPGLRAQSTLSQRSQPSVIIQSSMYFKSFTIALVSSIVASGAWFAYKDNSSESGVQLNGAQFANSASASRYLTTSTKTPTTSPAPPDFAAPIPPEESAEATRRALVVDKDQFYTGDIVGDQPLSKETDASGRLLLEMLNPEQATSKLRQLEQSYLVGRGQGVIRYDVTQLPSNNPIEDDHAEKIIEVPTEISPARNGTNNTDWMFWGVFDGHSGWTTSAKLRQTLISFVARELNSTYRSALADSTKQLPSAEAIDAAIKKGFVRLDNEIVHESVQKASKAKSKTAAVELISPAYSGSCALLSFYDPSSNLLRVACAGDSRAVLGRRSGGGKWTATALSDDQTGGTPSEMARLRKEHPGEEYVTRNGRILGQLEPSRAFGDAIYKWSQDTAMYVKKTFFGKTPSPLLKTPPYVTAEPIVTTTKIEPESGDFLVMATDGLWECLTNEEVVGLVGQWIDSQTKASSASALSSWFSFKSSLPVESPPATGKNGEGQRQPIRQAQWQVKDGDERFVVEDKNAATHLVRNALGGKNTDMVCALLSLPSPYSRRYRDDLTVEVIFFGSSPKSGDIVQNREASAVAPNGRPKL